MNTRITQIAKAGIFLCFFLAINGLTAQNQGDYKYVITSTVSNYNILEVNNLYYVFAHDMPQYTSIVMIFDEELNEVDQFPFPAILQNFTPPIVFYEDNYFYALGQTTDSRQFYFAKYDESFNLVQPIVFHDLGDTLEYIASYIYMTKNNEFITHFRVESYQMSYVLHINNKGEQLQEVSIPDFLLWGQIVETDNHYIINQFWKDEIYRFCKDSLEKYEILQVSLVEPWHEMFEGKAIAVGNQLIRSHECGIVVPGCEIATVGRSLIFYDEDMNIKNRLVVGKLCAQNESYGHEYMHYINPDSVYYVYPTYTDEYGYPPVNISIANFSWDGKLNFDHHLDILEDTLYKYICYCKASSNGDVLICGTRCDIWTATPDTSSGFILLYHPTKDVSVVEPHNYADLQVYPNPTKGQLTIKNEQLTIEKIEIYDVVGQCVFTTPNPTRVTTPNPSEGEESSTSAQFPSFGGAGVVIDVSHLASGMYFLKVDNRVARFVKE